MRHIRLTLFFLVILALSLIVPSWAQEKPRLMISPYENARNIIIEKSFSKTFAVGVAKNTGNVSLSLTLYWLQAYGNYTLPLIVYPPTKILSPEQLCEVSIEIKEDAKIGFYNGTVEVEAVAMQQLLGNPIVPGGSFPIGVTIVPCGIQEPPINQTQPEEVAPKKFSYTIPIAIALAITVFSVVAIVYVKKRRKPVHA